MGSPETDIEETNPSFIPERRIDSTYEHVVEVLQNTGKIRFFPIEKPVSGASKASKVQDDIGVGLEVAGYIVESEQTGLIYFVPIRFYEASADRMMDFLREIL